MQIPCFMLSWIVIPSWWILSNHLDFSNHNFVTKLPNPGSLKLPTINCFLMRELWLGKLFHWQFVFTKSWYNQKQPNKAQPKILSCCDEIMLRDEITGFDGTYLLYIKGTILSVKEQLMTINTRSFGSLSARIDNYPYPPIYRLNIASTAYRSGSTIHIL